MAEEHIEVEKESRVSVSPTDGQTAKTKMVNLTVVFWVTDRRVHERLEKIGARHRSRG
jgi:hypothetical protein